MIKVFMINLTEQTEEQSAQDTRQLPDYQFIAQAEAQGRVYDLDEFATGINDDEISTIESYMRILDVDMDEEGNYITEEEKEFHQRSKRPFNEIHAEAVKALNELSERWEEEKIKRYPKYLPSFDEFVADFSIMLEEKGE